MAKKQKHGRVAGASGIRLLTIEDLAHSHVETRTVPAFGGHIRLAAMTAELSIQRTEVEGDSDEANARRGIWMIAAALVDDDGQRMCPDAESRLSMCELLGRQPLAEIGRLTDIVSELNGFKKGVKDVAADLKND